MTCHTNVFNFTIKYPAFARVFFCKKRATIRCCIAARMHPAKVLCSGGYRLVWSLPGREGGEPRIMAKTLMSQRLVAGDFVFLVPAATNWFSAFATVVPGNPAVDEVKDVAVSIHKNPPSSFVANLATGVQNLQTIYNIITEATYVNICTGKKFCYYKAMISKEEVEHIAKLARLELTSQEVEKMQKDLSAILDYFALLKKAPNPDKDKKSEVATSNLRKDEVISSHEMIGDLIAAAPDKKEGYIKVKAIL